MRSSTALWRQTLRLTFFTRPHCGLCVEAKDVLSKVWQRRPFEYDEVNVMADGKGKWKGLYEFDTPVLHIDRAEEGDNAFETTAEARKLMHRITEREVEGAMDEVAKNTSSSE